MLGWGTCKKGYNPAMSGETGVREDVSVLVTEWSPAESRVSHVKVRGGGNGVSGRGSSVHRPRAGRDEAVWH